MAYGSRELSMEVAKDSPVAIFNCFAGKCCHDRRRISERQRQCTLQMKFSPGNLILSLLRKPFRVAFLVSHLHLKGFREKSRELQLRIEEEIAQLFAFCSRGRRNFTCRRVDAFLGSDENKFRSDENSQLVTIKRTFECSLQFSPLK